MEIAEQKSSRVSIIAALGKNREIGLGDQLLWRISDDLKRFKALTLGHPVIMGRKTFDSIIASLGHTLPERTSIVLTREPNWHHDGALRANSIEEAFSIARTQQGSEEIFVIGGGQIYALALPYADILHLTIIDDTKDCDTYFPAYEHLFTKKLSEEKRESGGLRYSWTDLGR